MLVLLSVLLANATVPSTPTPIADFINNLPQWLTAFGTIGATLVALGFLRKHPRLRIELQHQTGTENAYWHESRGISPNHTVEQLRVWLNNDGDREARNCRLKLTVQKSQLKADDVVDEFLLPATVLYSPAVVQDHLKAPDEVEASITIAPHSREAFDLVNYVKSLSGGWVYVYSKTKFLLVANVEYVLTVTAYADETKPSRPSMFRFLWNGKEEGLGMALIRLDR